MKMRLCILSWILLLVVAVPVHAQEVKRIEVDVESGFVPTHGVGLLLSSTGTIQRDCIDIKKTPSGSFVATFIVKDQEIKSDSVATVMVFGLSDQVAFGNVRPVAASMPGKSALTLPLCDNKVQLTPAIQGEVAALTTLGDYRETRRDVVKTKVEVMMKGRFLEKLRTLEAGFGIDTGKPLSADMPPTILIDRLSRILVSLQNYSDQRSRVEAQGEGQ